MNRNLIVVSALLFAVSYAAAKLPPAPPKTAEEQAAAEQKAKDEAAKTAAQLNAAEDRAVANYDKNKGLAAPQPAAPANAASAQGKHK